MSTWLDHWDRRYTERVRLLVEILPVLAQEHGHEGLFAATLLAATVCSFFTISALLWGLERFVG